MTILADFNDSPIPFGVDAGSGKLLDSLHAAAFDEFLNREGSKEGNSEQRALKAKAEDNRPTWGPSADAVDDPNDLGESGWGVLFSPSADAGIREALEPLLTLRRGQAGLLFRSFEDRNGLLSNEEALYHWLGQFGVGVDQPVNPKHGVPYYLLIVAPPEEIPFEFQYLLDIQWAVGRIWFQTVDEFRRYAESVVRYESAGSVRTSRQIAVFAPEHELDPATRSFSEQVARPLVDAGDPIGQKRRYRVQKFLGADATRENLHRIWSGAIDNGPPAVVFSGSHGVVFPPGHPDQDSCQGAILCQDWEGAGKIRREHYYAAVDLPASAGVYGMVYFLFACYGAGWPQFDDFGRIRKSPAVIGPRPMLSRLPQALLSHPNGGALAVIGHVDRAWSYSFQSGTNAAQIDGFRDVLARILRGHRVGDAMDQFNQRWAAHSARLAQLLRQWFLTAEAAGWNFETPMGRRLSSLWVARDDTRNYIVFGDPAVRLRVEDMPEIQNLAG